MNDLIFYPPAVAKNNQWYRFFSCGLIHADIPHLGFNMLSLYLFGRFVEDEFVAIFQEKGKDAVSFNVCNVAGCLFTTYLFKK